MKLWLVRHAQPLLAQGICYGRLDVAADAGATADCAQRLASELPAAVQVVSSPLRRCEQLAQALQALRPELTYTCDERLQEMNFGCWEGRDWLDIDRTELAAWTTDFPNYPVGHEGESVTDFMRRVASVFDALGTIDSGLEPAPENLALFPAQKAKGPENQGQTDRLWITHAGVIRAAELLSQGLRHIERAGQWPLEAPKYGQWRTLDLRTGPAHRQITPGTQATQEG